MITIETEITDTQVFPMLEKVNAYLAKIARCYFVDRYIHKRELSELKSAYLQKYLISGRHFNSIRSQVDGLVAAHIELQKSQMSGLSSRIKQIENDIASKQKKNKQLSKTLSAIEKYKIKIAHWKKAGRIKKKPRQIKSILKKDSHLLKKELKQNKFMIHQKNRKKAILESKLRSLEKQELPRICFGSRRLLNKQHHLRQNNYKDHSEWLKDWQEHRNSESFWLGAWNESFRNLNAQYEPWKKELSLRLPDYFLEEHGSPRLAIKVPDFPYRHMELEDTILGTREVFNKRTAKLEKRHMPVSYRLKFKIIKGTKRLFLQASFVPRQKEIKYGDKKLGAIGIDLNANHIAWCETDRSGNPINKGSLAFDPKGSSGLIEAQFGDHIASLVAYAKKADKPLVCEHLDFSKKKIALKETVESRKQRKVLSEFRYKKFYQMLSSRAQREQVKLKKVSASFSSIIGFAKFNGYSSYSSHELAALVLARRYLRFSERPKTHGTLVGTVSIPSSGEATKIRHVWSNWSQAKKKILKDLSLYSSPGISSGLCYSPLHPTGFDAIKESQLGCRTG